MPQSRPFTSKEITVKFSLKKALTAASVVILGCIIAVAAWKFINIKSTDSKSSQETIISDESSLKKTDFFSYGERLLEENNLDQALVQFQKALNDNPNDLEARLKAAFILENQGKTEEAVSEYKKAIEANPQDPRPYESLASLFEQKNDLNKALDFYRKYLKTAPLDDKKKIEENLSELEERIRSEQGEETKVSSPVVKVEDKPEKEKIIPEKTDVEEEKQKRITEKPKAGKKEEITDEKEEIIPEKTEFEGEKQKGINEKTEAGKKEVEKKTERTEQKIIKMVNDYRDSLKNHTLVLFYERNCTPEFFSEIKKDAEWIMSSYEKLDSFITDINIRFMDMNKADASISLIITGTSKKDGIKQSLFEGIYKWKLVKKNNQWKISEVSSHSTNK
jgi:tetratricopeptide (TPR) repeat protein